jgi:hypothetical protein
LQNQDKTALKSIPKEIKENHKCGKKLLLKRKNKKTKIAEKKSQTRLEVFFYYYHTISKKNPDFFRIFLYII